jgi:signal peptidase II
VSARGRDFAPRLALVAALVALDQWTKVVVFEGLTRGADGTTPWSVVYDHHGHARHPVLGDWLAWMLSENAGMAFGRLAGVPWILVPLRLVLAVVLGVWLWRVERRRRWLALALCLILAGALGNLWDNLALREASSGHPFGLVRDWVDVYFACWDWHFSTFNVADACISVGAVIVFLASFAKSGAAAPAPAHERPRGV